MKLKVVLLVILSVYRAAAMAQNNLGAFFPEVKNDLTKITWDHAVNSKLRLDSALKSKSVMMLEADVLIGNLTTDSNAVNIPIIGHPPITTSDLSLEQFMITIKDYNSNTNKMKGIKLDFKSIDAFNASIPFLRNYTTNATYPIWLNADILKGPGNPLTTPVNATQFLSGINEFKNSTLSLGWTTNFDKSLKNVIYTKANVEEMLTTVARVEQPITFPVRAVYVADSEEQMKQLVGNNTNRTLTVWSGADDVVDATKLKSVILDIGKDKVYVDVPKDLMDKLGFQNSGCGSTGVNVVSVLLFNFMTVLLARNILQ